MGGAVSDTRPPPRRAATTALRCEQEDAVRAVEVAKRHRIYGLATIAVCLLLFARTLWLSWGD